MPVLGADPDAPTKEWEEPSGTFIPAPGRAVYSLTQHFGYHPNMKMSMRFNDEDRLVLYRHFSRMLKKGYTEPSLKTMVDRFFQSWGGDTAAPAYVFVSNKMQEQLQDEFVVVKDDSVLTWLLDGMPDGGPFDDSRGYRRALLMSYDEALHRYPDVVADILRRDYSHEHVARAILVLNDLIWYHDAGDERPELTLLEGIDLPEELKATRRRRLRPRQGTVAKAIAAIPVNRAVKW